MSDLDLVDTDFELFLERRTQTMPHPYEASGIYILYCGREIVYVGQSVNMYARIIQHARSIEFSYVKFIECPPHEMNNAEARFIMRFQPKHNKAMPKNSVFMRLSNAIKIASRFDGMAELVKKLPVSTFLGVEYVSRNDILRLK